MNKLLASNATSKPILKNSLQSSLPNKVEMRNTNPNRVLANQLEKYEPKTKQYCCLHHYLQGKNTKGTTPCNNHVSLGVINPITTLTRQQRQKIKDANMLKYKISDKKDVNLVVNAEAYEFNFHTHFLNEIYKRGSLPNELVRPREYVEKVYPKSNLKEEESFLYPKSQTKAQYKQIYNLYKQLAGKTQLKTEKELKQDVIKFARSNNFKTINFTSSPILLQHIDKTTAAQYLFSKQDFISYLMSHQFSQKEAQDFWQLVYNKDRFTIPERSESSLAVFKNDFVSMKAFIYNYKKFYLEEEEYYRNMFSEHAFRQRMIDLRLILEPWFNRNIVVKSKLKRWKNNELQVADYLRSSGYFKEYEKMIKLIDDRNRLYMMMRTLAKSIYDLTDQKNFGMNVWNDRITFLIEEKSDSLICFIEFIEKFKTHLIEKEIQGNNHQNNNEIKVTDILQFLNQNNKSYEEMEEQWIIKWIRNIYKYLFYYKDSQQLYLDPVSFKLSCKCPISIQKQLLSEFISFKINESDCFLDVLRSLTQEVQEKLSGMPQLQGKKQYLVECNYLSETLLRIIRKNNFAPFKTLFDINKVVQQHWFDFQNCCQQIIDILRYSSQKQISLNNDDKFWKELFTPQKNRLQEINNTQAQSNQEPYTYKDALDKYQNVKQALGIETKAINKITINTNAMSKKDLKSKPIEKQVKNLSKNVGTFIQKTQREKEEVKQKVEQFDWNLTYKTHKHEHHSQGYCLNCDDVISTEVSSSISRVQDMENYLADLLRNVQSP